MKIKLNEAIQKIHDSYVIHFSKKELAEEDWKCFNQLQAQYIEYMEPRYIPMMSVDDHFVSTLGRICKLTDKGYQLLPVEEGVDGYLYVKVKGEKYRVDHFVAYAFLKPKIKYS